MGLPAEEVHGRDAFGGWTATPVIPVTPFTGRIAQTVGGDGLLDHVGIVPRPRRWARANRRQDLGLASPLEPHL